MDSTIDPPLPLVDPGQDSQLYRAASWSLMLQRAGKHKDPNPPSPKARVQTGYTRADDHAFNRFHF